MSNSYQTQWSQIPFSGVETGWGEGCLGSRDNRLCRGLERHEQGIGLGNRESHGKGKGD